MARPGAPRQHLGERVHAPARVGPAARRRPRRAGRARRRSGPPDPGGHRVLPHARLRRHRGPAQSAEGAGRQDRHRRLRHRVLVARLPAAVPGRRLEDRPVVRGGHEPLARRRGPGPHAGRARAHARARDPGRGHRDARAARGAAGRALRPGSRVLVLRTDRRRRDGRAARHRPGGPAGRAVGRGPGSRGPRAHPGLRLRAGDMHRRPPPAAGQSTGRVRPCTEPEVRVTSSRDGRRRRRRARAPGSSGSPRGRAARRRHRGPGSRWRGPARSQS